MSLLPPPCRGGVWSKVLSSRPCGYESPWTGMFPLFGFQVSSPTVRAVACDGMRPRSRRSPMRACMHSGRPVCIRMHPGMHTFFLPVSAWFQRSGDGPGACMHCMHHSLIGDSGKRKETPYIDAYNAYKRKEFFFSFIYKGFRAFSGLFLYASPDAYRCIHAYKTGRKTLQYCKGRR